MPRRQAVCLSWPSSSTGASMMFSITVRWGKRLKDWNTIPIRRRTAHSWAPLAAAMSCPSTRISPAVEVSSRLMQRSRVLLPVPEGPMTEITSPRNMSVFTSWRGVTLG